MKSTILIGKSVRRWWTQQRLLIMALLLAGGCSQWTSVAPGVDYQQITRGDRDIHVVRIDLAKTSLDVIGSSKSHMGMTVSEYSKATKAIVAINADYFEESYEPIGAAAGPCGVWAAPKGVRRQPWIEVLDGRARFVVPATPLQPAPPSTRNAVAGWPMVVRDCRCLTARELPGSDKFTRSPHPRTAVGLSPERDVLYLVVSDGRREGAPGLTLEELGCFMQQTLGVCEALNLDGGGSTTLVVNGRVVNRPSDGPERRVGNFLGVVEGGKCEE